MRYVVPTLTVWLSESPVRQTFSFGRLRPFPFLVGIPILFDILAHFWPNVVGIQRGFQFSIY